MRYKKNCGLIRNEAEKKRILYILMCIMGPFYHKSFYVFVRIYQEFQGQNVRNEKWCKI